MFPEKYARLEQGFQDQVECDRRKYEPGGGYLPNFTPSGPVDYILVAMEPSTGVHGGHEGQAPESSLNFSWSVEDFILHYCAREYLCRRGETITLRISPRAACPSRMQNATDKRGMKGGIPCCGGSLPLLQTTEKTRLIAVGKVVEDFLKKKGLCKQVERVLHYSPAAASHRDKAIQP